MTEVRENAQQFNWPLLLTLALIVEFWVLLATVVERLFEVL
jgi:hypothetical protein